MRTAKAVFGVSSKVMMAVREKARYFDLAVATFKQMVWVGHCQMTMQLETIMPPWQFLITDEAAPLVFPSVPKHYV